MVPENPFQEIRMIDNRQLLALSSGDMATIDSIAENKCAVRYWNLSNQIGFDIFLEDVDEPFEGTNR